MQILILGASGMAGHLITTYLMEKQYTVTTLASSHKYNEHTVLLDVCNIPLLTQYLDTHHFDYVINCTGLLIQACEKDKPRAILINTHLPHYLESYYHHTPTRIIHLSTDCVFSGKDGPYTEHAHTNGVLFYDLTKALGELNNPKDLTLRMSIIGPDTSPSGIGLFNWFMSQKGNIYGYTNVFWNGITTLELARAIECILVQPISGLYHLVPPLATSKYNLLNILLDVFPQKSLVITPQEVEPLNKILINTRTDLNYTLPPYPQMIIELKQWIIDHKLLYPHYHLDTDKFFK